MSQILYWLRETVWKCWTGRKQCYLLHILPKLKLLDIVNMLHVSVAVTMNSLTTWSCLNIELYGQGIHAVRALRNCSGPLCVEFYTDHSQRYRSDNKGAGGGGRDLRNVLMFPILLLRCLLTKSEDLQFEETKWQCNCTVNSIYSGWFIYNAPYEKKTLLHNMF